MIYEIFLGTCLVLPTVVLGYGYYVDFFSYGVREATWLKALLLMLLVSYVVFLFLIGSEQAISLFKDTGGLKRIEGLYTYIAPGLLFASACFPKQLANLLFTYERLNEASAVIRFFSYLGLLFISIRHALVLWP
ncbi:hypothetical protein SNR37_000267 [Agarivorans aestuarii]|uniref:Uncharacterized protein n=1 Tax=Agarivorans aestuarii TaxID=1563703 RepID=A0ABU7G6N5_9ALTE|nr:hypothetical protein [Agarivorans aestuarii]MEE1674945.1 hypothetical protein [Agarivorans aestuarii]